MTDERIQKLECTVELLVQNSQQSEAKIDEALNFLRERMATKVDLEKMATKEDLEKMATKGDIQQIERAVYQHILKLDRDLGSLMLRHAKFELEFSVVTSQVSLILTRVESIEDLLKRTDIRNSQDSEVLFNEVEDLKRRIHAVELKQDAPVPL